MRAYESILEVINDKTVKKNQDNKTTIDYYEAQGLPTPMDSI